MHLRLIVSIEAEEPLVRLSMVQRRLIDVLLAAIVLDPTLQELEEDPLELVDLVIALTPTFNHFYLFALPDHYLSFGLSVTLIAPNDLL